jgi:hypothetical protein
MAKVICPNCKGHCVYNEQTGWWDCANDHHLKLESVVPEEPDKSLPRCGCCWNEGKEKTKVV